MSDDKKFKSEGANLLATSSLVETPFIIVTIGDYTFGKFTGGIGSVKTTFPNYIESLQITKINGSVNLYTLGLVYALTPGNDPNMIEKVFGSVSTTRMMKISYGDYSVANAIFKDEQAIITEVNSNIDFNSNCLKYTVKATSTSLGLTASNHNFPARTAKPSTIIAEIINDKSYGVSTVLPGMSDIKKLQQANMLASNDKVVSIEAKQGINTLDYLNYLVRCMSPTTGSNNTYKIAVVDDIDSEFGGAYFKVVEVGANKSASDSLDTFAINIGYPDATPVISFSLDNQETYSILYDYSGKIQSTDYGYRIGSDGKLQEIVSPSISTSTTLLRSSKANENWWNAVTSFPVSCTLTIRGLLRPSILCSYVRLNVLFYGQEHCSSGLYIITKQIDTIDKTGFRTQLSLLRVDGDDNMMYTPLKNQ